MGTPYWICCSCDAPMSCAACGVEQPNDNDEITRLTESCESYKAQVEAGAAEIARLTAALARAREALEVAIEYMPGQPSGCDCSSCQAFDVVSTALSSISEPVK